MTTTSFITELATVGRPGARREYGAVQAEGVEVERRYSGTSQVVFLPLEPTAGNRFEIPPKHYLLVESLLAARLMTLMSLFGFFVEFKSILLVVDTRGVETTIVRTQNMQICH